MDSAKNLISPLLLFLVRGTKTNKENVTFCVWLPVKGTEKKHKAKWTESPSPLTSSKDFISRAADQEIASPKAGAVLCFALPVHD